MSPILPGSAVIGNQTKVRLVNQSRGLEDMSSPLIPHVAGRLAPEFLIDDRHTFNERGRTFVLQDFGDARLHRPIILARPYVEALRWRTWNGSTPSARDEEVFRISMASGDRPLWVREQILLLFLWD